jgi:hypothetical protein
MPKYRATINGRNFLLEVDGKVGRFGFFQTVFVDATDPTQAEFDAVRIIKTNAELQSSVKNRQADPPSLHLEHLVEVAPSEVPSLQPQGRTLYPEKRWWQFWR